jgi:hypothetical protein
LAAAITRTPVSARSRGTNRETECRLVDDDETIGARRIEPIHERRHILDADALGLSIAALRRNRDEAGASKSQTGLRLLHRHMPASSSTVATQIEFEPDMLRVVGLHDDETHLRASRFTWRKTPPRGSSRTKLHNAPSLAMKRDCSHKVSPGAGATPPTITSPTSPPAWQVTTLMILEDRMVSTARRSRKLLISSLSTLALQQRLSGDLLVHRIGRAPSASHQARGMPANFCTADMQGIPPAWQSP